MCVRNVGGKNYSVQPKTYNYGPRRVHVSNTFEIH